VVAVAAIDSADSLASFSQYGATTVDLAAPGVGIRSTVPNNAYASYSGTSMATPHVTGAAALCASMNPGISAAAIRNALLSSVAAAPTLTGKTVTGGRLDIGAMMQACLPTAAGPVTGAPTVLSATANGASSVTLKWTDAAAAESRYDIERALSTAGVCGAYSVVASLPPNSTGYTSVGLTPGTGYCFRVRALNTFNGGTASAYSNEAQATTKATTPPFACAGSVYSWIDPSSGTSYALADDASASVTLPFRVTLYGDAYTTASISSNGFIRLGSGAAIAYANAAIPGSAEPNAIIAPWWDDLNPALGGSIRTLTTGTAPNRTFVAAWVGVPHIGGTSTAVTFEAVIDEATGDISFQYLDALTGNTASDRGVGATIGLENGLGTLGTQISFNTGSRADKTAVRCSSSGVSSPLAIATASLPGASSTTAYSQMLQAVGGRLGYTWSVASGALPAGLTLYPTLGVIGGLAAAGGTSTFTMRVTDGAGTSATASYSITVSAPPPPPVVVTPLPGAFNKSAPANNATGRSRTSLSLTWGASTNAARYEYCVDTINDNACNTSWTSTGTARSATIGGLASRTAYYWQVRSVNTTGTVLANAGTSWKFTTA